MEKRYRIGVDVGGTNTDAVLLSLNPNQVVASQKCATTHDVTNGITSAILGVVKQGTVPLDKIDCVIIGTTHFVNAIVQRSHNLHKVAVVRLSGGGAFGASIYPFIDFPTDLKHMIEAQSYFCNGGYQIDGSEISPVDREEIKKVADDISSQSVYNVVVSGIYSPVNAQQELQVAELLHDKMKVNFSTRGERNEDSRVRVTMSHTVSSLGFLARENAAILNATLKPLAEKIIRGFQAAIRGIFRGMPCKLYLTQNDGSVLDASQAIEHPIRTFNSGPTNSIRGGAFLWSAADVKDPDDNRDQLPSETALNGESGISKPPLVVLDIGGTTTDSGLLVNGIPRMSSVASIIGGVKTNFGLPAVESTGLGGGSIVRQDGQRIVVGPESVGHEITRKGRVFGGRVLTATDIAIARNLTASSPDQTIMQIGNSALVTNVSQETIGDCDRRIRDIVEDLVDRTKISRDDVDVLIVGGGAIILNISEPLKGVKKCRKVAGGEVANAVGAAIAKVSGVADEVLEMSNKTMSEAKNVVCQAAVDAAIRNGAEISTVEIVEITILPVQYMDSRVRIIARAVGELDLVQFSESDNDNPDASTNHTVSDSNENYEFDDTELSQLHEAVRESLDGYTPQIRNREWIVSIIDLDYIAIGCKILGCGGGGDPYIEYLKVKSFLQKKPGCIRVVSPKDLQESALVGWTGNMGSPEVSHERLEGNECFQAAQELARFLGLSKFDAMLALEIGGGNGLVSMDVALQYNIPVVDADCMGRAYPTLWQVTPNVYDPSGMGKALLPTAIASGDGSFMIMTGSKTDKLVDRALRSACVDMGSRAGSASRPLTGSEVKDQAVSNTISLAWRIGRAVRTEKDLSSVVERILEEAGGHSSAVKVTEGKIVGVERTLKKGHTFGLLEIESQAESTEISNVFRIPFKNENALVEKQGLKGSTKILASVPDLIAVLDAETGFGLGVAEYKYGLKVVVIAITAAPQWTETSRGLEIGGPGSMGFENIQYQPVGKYHRPRSIIDEFGTSI